MVGLVKTSLYKTIGKGCLTWTKLGDVWRRWTKEYVRGLREIHIQYHGKPLSLAVGDVVVIKSDEQKRGEWPLGIITEFYKGKDGVIRAARLRAGKSYMERPIQYFYPMELNCDMKKAKERQPSTLDANASQFRPKRKAAAVAAQRIQQIAEEER